MLTKNVFPGPVFNRESMEAYLRSQALETRAIAVLGLLYDNPQGLTQDETACRLDMLTQTTAPIFTNLLKGGLIERKCLPGANDYETRPTRNGSNAAVCVIVSNWQTAVLQYRERKIMARETEREQKHALAENVVLRGIVADLVGIIEEAVPFKDADLSEALELIRSKYLS